MSPLDVYCSKSNKMLLKCMNCGKEAGCYEIGVPNHFALLQCDVCKSSWSVCVLCNSQKTRYTNKKQKSRHTAYHLKSKKQRIMGASMFDENTFANECVENGNEIFMNESNFECNRYGSVSNTVTDSSVVVIEDAFLTDNSKKYFSNLHDGIGCLLYTSPSPRDLSTSRMPSSA